MPGALTYREMVPRGVVAAGGRFAPMVALEADLFHSRHSRLAAKLLIFTNLRALHGFWREWRGSSLSDKCRGVVTPLYDLHESYAHGEPASTSIEVDPKYFAVCGLAKRHLSMEIISHEAVHLGYAYRKRIGRNVLGSIGDFDEEQIAYPAGALAAAMNRAIHAQGLYS